MARSAQPRRTPQQERSRDRVQAILDAARQLIGERGNDAVSMREIALQAGVPIASVYDYFRDKNEILRALMVIYMSKIQNRIAGLLLNAKTVADLFVAIGAMVDALEAIFREERELPTIWGAVQANTKLRNLDIEDGHRIAEFLIARYIEIMPKADPEIIRDACIYAVSTVATTVRMAVYTNPGDGERLIREFKTLMRLRLQSVLDSMPNTNG